MARQQDDVEIIGIAARDSLEAFEEFVTRHELDHVRTIADVDGAVWNRFGVRGQPSWLFIDGETGGTEAAFGALGAERLAEHVEALQR